MPLSTSNFSHIKSKKPWEKILLISVIFSFLLLGLWEMYWRTQGYPASYDDTPSRWSWVYDKIESNDPNQVVIIGSSRVLFGLRLDILQHLTGEHPIQLAIPGTSPVPILNAIANDTGFNGTLIVGVTPPLFFAPGGPPIDKPKEWLAYSKRKTIADSADEFLLSYLESTLAFINREDLTLKKFMESTNLPNLSGVMGKPHLPPFMYNMEADRQTFMLDKVRDDPALNQLIKDIWVSLFSLFPPTPPEVKDSIINTVKADIDKIRERGGRVIFVRMPSSDWLREHESKVTPKAQFWDSLIEKTGAIGVHFEDYPELQGFEIPEWSHLSKNASFKFSINLTEILQKRLNEEKNHEKNSRSH